MSAILSPCGTYRYRLERPIAGRPLPGKPKTWAVLMVNPSTADALKNDQTIIKVVGFGRINGARQIIVGNKFAYRATDIKELRTAADPIGPENDAHLEQIMRDADFHLVAWGRLKKLPLHLRARFRDVLAIADRVGCRLHCLGTTEDGQPVHPLLQAYSRPLIEWSRP